MQPAGQDPEAGLAPGTGTLPLCSRTNASPFWIILLLVWGKLEHGMIPAVAPHHARELARDGKAEPSAAVAARGQGIGLGEILKQFRLLLRRHADAAIRDGKLDPVASVR